MMYIMPTVDSYNNFNFINFVVTENPLFAKLHTCMKLKLCLLFLLFAGLAHSQDDEYENKRLSLEVMPCGLIDGFSSPSYQGGVEFRIYKALSMNISAGGYFGGWVASQTNVKGYLVRIEPKIYPPHADGGYTSVECLYKKESFDWTDSIMLSPPYEKTFRIFKSNIAFTLKIGQCKTFKSGIVIDWYVGLGVRFKNVTSTLTPLEAKHMSFTPAGVNEDPSDTYAAMYSIGNYWVPNIELGVKIGYCLWR